MRVAILTVSDAVAQGQREDVSGVAVAARCKELKFEVVSSAVRADDRDAIESVLKTVADSCEADLILTTGGTGLGPRDITPEATVAACERLIPGIAEFIRTEGLKKTPRAILSRAVAGIRGETLIINLPGSPKGALESLNAIAAELPHAIDVIRGARHD